MTTAAVHDGEPEPVEKDPSQTRAAADVLRAAFRKVGTPLGAIGLLALMYGAVGLLYLDTTRRAEAVEQRIASSVSALSRPAPDIDRSTIALTGWQAAVEGAVSRRVDEIADADLLERLLETAAGTGVRVFSAGIKPGVVTMIDDTEYLGTPVSLKVDGPLEAIEAFLLAVESRAIDTLEVRTALVSESAGIYVLNISAVVYSQIESDEPPTDEPDSGTPGPVVDEGSHLATGPLK